MGLLPPPYEPTTICVELGKRSIEARQAFKPMHQQPVFVGRGTEMRGGAVADDLFARGICLPSGSTLTDDQQGRVIDEVRVALAARPTMSVH